MPSPTPVKAIAYARVSTLLGQNPEHQLVPIRSFADTRGFQLINEYVDKGISGVKDRRPALDQILVGAKRGEFKVIIIAAIDRLARNVRHLINLIHELDGYGVTVVSLRENLDFNSPLGQALLVITGVLSQLEREIIRERIKTALAAKKKLAQDCGSDWRCGRPNIVTPERIEQILTLRGEGKSIRKIERSMNGAIGRSSIGKIIKDRSGK